MPATDKKTGRLVTSLAFFSWGLSMLARTAFGYYLEPLGITSTQAGTANFLTSGCICFSAVLVSRWAEKHNAFTKTLIAALAGCAAATALLSAAKSFAVVLLAKALLGIFCGPLFTLLMTLTERASTPQTYAANAGIVANGEAILNTIIGPVMIVFLIGKLGMPGANGLLAAVLAALAAGWWLCRKRIPDGAPDKKPEARTRTPVAALLRSRNLLLSIVGAVLSLCACWCVYMYAPTMLLASGRYSDSTMSYIMTAMGVFMAIWMLLLPVISERLGRKPVTIAATAAGSAALLALYFKADSLLCVSVFILFGGCSSVVSMLYMALICTDSVSEEESPTAVAVVNGTGELLGSSVGPLIAGVISDAYGVRYGMLFAGCAMALLTVIGGFLKKTGKREKEQIKK